MAKTLRICMLNAEAPIPAIASQRAPTFGRIFHNLLANVSPNITIESADFDVTKMEYPDCIDDFDAIILGGSAASAYDDVPWVHRLDKYIQDVYQHHPRVKIFGSCFGHQLICQSLLKDYGVKVEVDPKGWEIGVKEITLHENFRHIFSKSDNEVVKDIGQKMRIQFIHQDHVLIPNPDALPPSWTTLGSTEHCAVQGVYEPGRVLTFQGHFEYDRFINTETVKFFLSAWDHESLQIALADIDAEDDAIRAAGMVLQFFVANQHNNAASLSAGMRDEISSAINNTNPFPITVES